MPANAVTDSSVLHRRGKMLYTVCTEPLHYAQMSQSNDRSSLRFEYYDNCSAGIGSGSWFAFVVMSRHSP